MSKRKAEPHEGSSLPDVKRFAKDLGEDNVTYSPFSILSPELALAIFSFVPLNGVPNLCLTCQDWRRLVEADWKTRYLQRWPCA